MFQSKALKDGVECGCKPKANTILHSIWHFLKFDVYYVVEHFFSHKVKQLLRMYQWAKFGLSNYDFDGVYLYSTMEFKLKRIQKCLLNGHAIQEQADMDALERAITLTNRLGKSQYEEPYYDAIESKWGDYPPIKTEPILDEKDEVTSYRWISQNRTKVLTPQDEIDCRNETQLIDGLVTKDREKDLDELNEILKKHSARWWD